MKSLQRQIINYKKFESNLKSEKADLKKQLRATRNELEVLKTQTSD